MCTFAKSCVYVCGKASVLVWVEARPCAYAVSLRLWICHAMWLWMRKCGDVEGKLCSQRSSLWFGWVRFAFAGLLAPKLLGQDDVVLRLKCVSMSALPTWGCTHTPAHSVSIQAQRGCEGALNGSCFPCPFSYFHLCLISPVCRPYWGRLTVRTLKAPFSSRAA